jgi:hypothetical protein
MKKLTHYALVPAVTLATSVPAWAQDATGPIDQLQAGASTNITKLGVMAAALAIVVVGVKVVPAALKWVLAFINK